jgi:ubiquinone/menaquinone biosynthesis C-methylase UbiE
MSQPSTQPFNAQVRDFWEREPCGTGELVTGSQPRLTREWFEQVEEHRYRVEPFIHSIAQFTRHHGRRILEVGVGAGTDHLQWARAGTDLHGVDLTDAAIETTRARLAIYGLSSKLRRVDAEILPFPDGSFDVVYSWGVIHHSADPERIVGEILRVLRPGGQFIGMLYGRHSVVAFQNWVRFALLTGKPWRTFRDVIWHHMESIGTKCYTVPELRRMFAAFSDVRLQPMITSYDCQRIPRLIHRFLPDDWGWFIAVTATR